MDDDATSGPASACQAALAGTSVADFLAARPPSTVVSVSDAQVTVNEGVPPNDGDSGGMAATPTEPDICAENGAG